jgi:hypothetical protein
MATKIGGYAAYAQYKYESTYGTAGSPTIIPFGQGLSITTSAKNNNSRIYGIGNRNAQDVVAGKFEGTASVEFDLSNGWFLRGMLGSPAVTTSGAVFMHEFKEANPQVSFTIENGMNMDTDSVRMLKGCVISNATITASVGEIAKVKLECPYCDETETTAVATAPVAEQWPSEPFTFAGGTLGIAGTTYADIQSIELGLNPNVEQVWGIGDRRARSAVGKSREYSMKANMAFQDATKFLEKVWGNGAGPLSGASPACSAYATLTFTNNQTGSALKRIIFNMGSIYFDEHSLPQNPNDVIKEDVSMTALYCGSATFEIGGSAGSPALA